MPYLNTNTRTSKATPNEQFQQMGRQPSLFGIFIGFVKDVQDVQRNGRLKVWIPELGTQPNDEAGWITVNYCSPFAGATNIDGNSTSNIESFEGTQTSYGMWMVPPDINNEVLVAFANGNAARGYWLGSVYNQFMNNMVPGMAADAKNYQYPGKQVPVAEYNKNDKKVTEPDRTLKPYQQTKFKGVGNQGLINDKFRGITNSSARREAPSSVFGILTPGPVIDNNVPIEAVRRKGGSSFIMDDGHCTEYVELSTKSGSKIRLDESNGFVYVINRDGTAWIQMDAEGNVDVFSAKNISLRAQRDFNIRADRNINIEAGQNIFLKAAKDTEESTTTFTYGVNTHPDTKNIPVWKYVGEGNGQGGNIAIQALNNFHSTTQKDAFYRVVENDMNVLVGTSFNLTTINGGQDYASEKGIKFTTDASFDLGAKSQIRIGTESSMNLVSVGNFALCSDSNISLNGSSGNSDIILTTGNIISLASMGTNISSNVNLGGNQNVTGTITAGGVVSSFSLGGPGSGPTPSSPVSAEGALSASSARPAEVKPLNEKLNILATWADPESKFKRNSEGFLTTLSRFPTYEPCPEHASYTSSSTSNNSPVITEADKTYAGSGGAGNTTTTAPPPDTNPGNNNAEITNDPVTNNSIASDFNLQAFYCQIKIHEGVVYKSYVDSTGLSAGVGHFLRTNEIAMYPLGTPVSKEQVDKWLTQDTITALKIAQILFKDVWADLSGIRKRALVDLAYNLGQPNLSKFTKFISAMNSKKFDVAAQELKNSKWFTQVGKRGPNIVTMIGQSVDPNGCDLKFPG